MLLWGWAWVLQSKFIPKVCSSGANGTFIIDAYAHHAELCTFDSKSMFTWKVHFIGFNHKTANAVLSELLFKIGVKGTR